MFNLSGEKLLVIFVVALVVLGPDHLPVAVRRVGQIMGQLRDLSEAFKREVSQALDDPGEPIVKPMSRPPLSAVPHVEDQTPDTADHNIGASLQDETTPLQDETTPLHDETTPLHDETTPLHNENIAPHDQSDHPAATPEKHHDA